MSSADSIADPFARYARQMRYAPLGQAGQQRLATARALVCGCGALGSAIADTLVRAGVGLVRIVDRDFVELNNLQRQLLFNEADVAAGLPKAIAAAAKLQAVNSQVTIDPVVADVMHKNIDRLASDIDVIVDGTDNFEVRFLLNDYALAHEKPWVYGGVIGAEGQTMTIVPGQTACLACLLADPPPPGVTPTCDSAGILAPAVHLIAALQSAEAIKLLSGNHDEISRKLTVVDLWQNHFRQVDLTRLRDAGSCRACGQREWPWLAGERGSQTAVLCGRNAVQLRPAEGNTSLELASLATQLAPAGEILQNDYLLRLTLPKKEGLPEKEGNLVLTLFADGRAIIAGTDNPATARSLYARLIGS